MGIKATLAHFFANTSLRVCCIKGVGKKKTFYIVYTASPNVTFLSPFGIQNVSNHGVNQTKHHATKPFMGDKKGQRPPRLSGPEEMRQTVTIRKEPHSHRFLSAFIDTKTLQQCVNCARTRSGERRRRERRDKLRSAVSSFRYYGNGGLSVLETCFG